MTFIQLTVLFHYDKPFYYLDTPKSPVMVDTDDTDLNRAFIVGLGDVINELYCDETGYLHFSIAEKHLNFYGDIFELHLIDVLNAIKQNQPIRISTQNNLMSSNITRIYIDYDNVMHLYL